VRIGRLEITKPRGSMGCFAAWQYETGYWRWAMYWRSYPYRRFGIGRGRSIHRSIEAITPWGELTLVIQPFMAGMARLRAGGGR
jgi:hypothetical protein